MAEEELRLSITLDDQATEKLKQIRAELSRLGGGARDVSRRLQNSTRELTLVMRPMATDSLNARSAMSLIGMQAGVTGIAATALVFGFQNQTRQMTLFSDAINEITLQAKVLGVGGAAYENMQRQLKRMGMTDQEAAGLISGAIRTAADLQREGGNLERVLLQEISGDRSNRAFIGRISEMLGRGQTHEVLNEIMAGVSRSFHNEVDRIRRENANVSEDVARAMATDLVRRELQALGIPEMAWAKWNGKLEPMTEEFEREHNRRAGLAKEYGEQAREIAEHYERFTQAYQSTLLPIMTDVNAYFASGEVDARALGETVGKATADILREVKDIVVAAGTIYQWFNRLREQPGEAMAEARTAAGQEAGRMKENRQALAEHRAAAWDEGEAEQRRRSDESRAARRAKRAAGRGFIRGRQHGGPVAGNEPYIVGEAGPELFVPGSSGQIVPGVGAGQSNREMRDQIIFREDNTRATGTQTEEIRAFTDTMRDVNAFMEAGGEGAQRGGIVGGAVLGEALTRGLFGRAFGRGGGGGAGADSDGGGYDAPSGGGPGAPRGGRRRIRGGGGGGATDYGGDTSDTTAKDQIPEAVTPIQGGRGELIGLGSLRNQPGRQYQRGGKVAGEFNVPQTGVFGRMGDRSNLVTVQLKNGQSLQVNKHVAERFKGFLDEAYDRGYRFKHAGSFNVRKMSSGGSWSTHSWGTSVDINVGANPYSSRGTTDIPADMEKLAWLYGISWGGRWSDAMHWESMSDQAWRTRLKQLGMDDDKVKQVMAGRASGGAVKQDAAAAETGQTPTTAAPQPSEQAAPSGGGGGGGRLRAGAGGRVDRSALYNRLVTQIGNTKLVGHVPRDGARYGIKTGSAQEWAHFMTELAQKESSLNTGTGNMTAAERAVSAGHGSHGLFQLSPPDARGYGIKSSNFTMAELKDPEVNAAAAVKMMEKRVMAGGISGAEGVRKYWGPLRRGWTPGPMRAYAASSQGQPEQVAKDVAQKAAQTSPASTALEEYAKAGSRTASNAPTESTAKKATEKPAEPEKSAAPAKDKLASARDEVDKAGDKRRRRGIKKNIRSEVKVEGPKGTTTEKSESTGDTKTSTEVKEAA